MGSENIVLFGHYEVIARLGEDPVFRWVRVKHVSTHETMIVQLLKAFVSPEEKSGLFDYFDYLSSAIKNKSFQPVFTLSDRDHVFGAFYPDTSFTPLSKAIADSPEKAADWWHAAGEHLFFMHNRDVVHGYICPDHIMLVDDDIAFVNYGYTPLLKAGNVTALNEVGNYCPPEVKREKRITPAADAYALAQTIAFYHPVFKTTEWYAKAIDTIPENRPIRLTRDREKKLHAALSILDSLSMNDSVVIPKYTLSVYKVPEMGGYIIGDGKYKDGETVKLAATASAGYIFSRWSGDIDTPANPITFEMNSNRHVTAHFTPIESRTVHLAVNVEPDFTGQVRGSGEYEIGARIRLKAIPSTWEWRFCRWSGDLTGDTNPVLIEMDKSKTITAHFSRKNGTSPFCR